MNRHNSVLCSRCKDYLIKFPVYASRNLTEVICDVCKNKNETQPRLTTYEKLARYLHFACHNEEFGCMESFLSSELLEHEKSCNYKQYKCEFCTWSGTYEDLIQHYKTESKQNENGFIIWKQNRKYLFSIENELFLLAVNDASKLSYYLLHIGWDKKDFECTLIFAKTKIKIKAKSYRNGCREFNICDLQMESKNFCKLEMCEVLKEPNLYKFGCTICHDIMIPPIYQCATGHSLCQSCMKKCNSCRSCRHPISKIRNVALEMLVCSLHIKMNCKYRECIYKCNILNLKMHEEECNFRPINCPIQECKWNNSCYKLPKHIDETHGNVVITDCFNINRNKKCKTYFYQVNNRIIKVDYKMMDDKIRLCIKHVGFENVDFIVCFQISAGIQHIIFNLKTIPWDDESNFTRISLKNFTETLEDLQLDCHISINRFSEVPVDVLESLKCHTCEVLLTKFPVYSDPETGNSYCFQCTTIPTNLVLECAYSYISKGLLFPCRYPNCYERFPPEELENHKNICNYKLSLCTLPFCSYKGTMLETIPHLIEKHNLSSLKPKKDIIIKNTPSKSKYNLQFLLSLKCNQCREYMVAPMYQYSSSINLCETCVNNKNVISNVRNFNLEKITVYVTYPCKYKCGGEYDSTAIKTHEKFCENSKFSCPKDGCIFKVTNTDLAQHIKKLHPKMLLSNPYFSYEFTEPHMHNFMFLQRDYNIFKFTFALKNKNFCFAMQYIGHPEDAEKYFYVVQILYDTQYLTIAQHICAPWIDDPFESPGFVKLPYKIFKNYLNRNGFVRKILPCYVNVFLR